LSGSKPFQVLVPTKRTETQMKNFVLLKDLPSYAVDGITSRSYRKDETITVQDDHVSGLAEAGYFDAESPIEDKMLEGAPSTGTNTAGLKPPYFDSQDRLVDGGLRPGAADLVGHEARGVNDPGVVVQTPGGPVAANPDPDQGPTGTKGAVDDPNSTAAPEIPENWEELSAAEKRELADSLRPEAEPTSNKAEAEARIREVLAEREAAKEE
jgi:hypothetical protein